MKNRLNKQIDFLKKITKLNRIEREIYYKDLDRKENDAEHSWHLAMFILLFEKELPKSIDNIKMLKLALTHDLVEIYAGDVYLFNDKGRKCKKENEKKAAKKLFSKLPPDLKDEFKNLFIEYEKKKTKEAKIVHAFDKIQPIIMNILSNGKSWKKNKISLDNIKSHKDHLMKENNNIQKIYNHLIIEIKDKKLTSEE